MTAAKKQVRAECIYVTISFFQTLRFFQATLTQPGNRRKTPNAESRRRVNFEYAFGEPFH
jgi:hypothetical protein